MRWGRPLVIALVVLALVGGTVGWYWYFRAAAPDEHAAVPVLAPPLAPSTSEAPTPRSAAPATASGSGERDTSEPLILSAREVREALSGHAPLTPEEAYVRHYQGREITWNGRVGTVTKEQSLVRLDLVDDDGLRIVAWCEPGREVTAGQRVTVRGRVMTKLANGFVVERCEMR
jgi:hypothetical protein